MRNISISKFCRNSWEQMQTLKQKSKKRYDKYLSKSNKSNVYGIRN